MWYRLVFSSFMLLLVGTSGFTQNRENSTCYHVINNDCPVEIEDYFCNYNGGTGMSTIVNIGHGATIKNRSNRNIIAVSVGYLSFNVWNEFLDVMFCEKVTTIAPNQKIKTLGCVKEHPKTHTFFTGVAFVWRVRFEDGEIWNADRDFIINKLNKLPVTFDNDTIFNETFQFKMIIDN